jgi:hypothetical protein
MQTMAHPSEIAACIEDKDASPQAVVRSLQSVVDRTRATSGPAGSGGPVLRGAGFEQAVLAHLGTMAEAMTGIASALGAKPKAVRAALQVLNSAEVGDDATDDEDAEDPMSALMHTRAHQSTPVRILRSCAHDRSCALVSLFLHTARRSASAACSLLLPRRKALTLTTRASTLMRRRLVRA